MLRLSSNPKHLTLTAVVYLCECRVLHLASAHAMLGEWDAARDYVIAAQRVVDGRLLGPSSENATNLRVPLLRALAILEVSLNVSWAPGMEPCLLP